MTPPRTIIMLNVNGKDYHTAFQCGFCTPGIIMSAKALLFENPSPARDEVKEALSGNFCRCISNYHVLDAVMPAAQKEGGDR